MPFWKKESPPPELAVAAEEPPPPPVLHGLLPCSEQGCSNHDAVQCSYIDRRGQTCLTAWCPGHQIVVANICFCRRHAGVPAAVQHGEFLADRGLPDTGNRSPSLVIYIGHALEPAILNLLHGLLRPGTADQVGTEAVHPIRPAAGGRRWVRNWQIYDHTGVVAKITVEVDEATDPEVVVRVGRHAVASVVPPWIERRYQGLPPLSADEDHFERDRFYAFLMERIAPAVVAEVRAAV
jgi:hypothetical protein